MSLRPIAKHFMIGVGIAATVVIVLLQAFPEISSPFPEEAKARQATEQKDTAAVVSVPADAVAGGAPMQVNEAERTLIDTLLNPKGLATEVKIFTHIPGDYLSVFLRACISPNAP